MYKTAPKKIVSRQSPISWTDEDEDIVATPEFLGLGLVVNWTRDAVVAFKARLDRENPFKEADDLDDLRTTGKIMSLRVPQLRAYFLTGPLVKEFMLLSEAIRDYQNSIKFKPATILGTNLIYPEFLRESEPRYRELIELFDKFVGLALFIDEESIQRNPKDIHYLFLEKNK